MAKKHKKSRKVRKTRKVHHQKKSHKGILPLEVLKKRARKLISLVHSRGGTV
jgi:hypothetical protein